MLAMWTTETEPKNFTHRNCNTSEEGDEKKQFFCLSFKKKLSLRYQISNYGWYESSVKKITYSVLLVMYGQNLTIKSKLTQIRQ